MSGNTNPLSLLLATGVAALFVAAVDLDPNAFASAGSWHRPCDPPHWAKGVLGDLYRYFKDCDRCDDGNPCTKDVKLHGRCVHKPLDGDRCDDDNACTRRDTCHAGVCQGTPRECEAGGACREASCNPKTGKCFSVPQTGTSCDDGDPCTGGDKCVAGKCRGSALDCSSDDPCQVGVCSAAGGCEFSPVADGTACDDGNVCDGPGICQAGSCVVTTAETITVGSPESVPMLVEAAPDGHVFVAANVVGQQIVAGQRVLADAEGDIFVTELDPRGNPVFSTLIAGRGKQQAVATSLDAKQSLQLFLETDQSIALELDVRTCELRDGVVFCTPPQPVDEQCTVTRPDGQVFPCNVCGNGVVDQPTERCDDGNFIEDDECTTDCLPPCICDDNGCDCGEPSPDPDTPGAIDPIPGGLGGSGGIIDPVAPGLSPNLTARAAAPITAAAVGGITCVVPGSPSIPGNAQVTLARSTGIATLVLVYPDLGAGGVWRAVYQPPSETHYVFGHTPNLTVFNTIPRIDGSDNLVAGSYSLSNSPAGCVQLAALPLASRGAWGSESPERAESASVIGGKLIISSSFAETFDLGGETVDFPAGCSTAVLGAYAIAALAPIAQSPESAASLVSSPPPSMEVCVVPAPPPPPPPAPLPTARALAPASAAALPVEIPTRGPALLTTPAGVWWGGAASLGLTLNTSGGPVEVPLLGEGLDAFVVLTDASGTRPIFTTDGPGDEAVRLLAADGDNLVVAGVFDTRIQFGAARFFSKGGRDIFVAKLTPSGDILFRATYGGPGEDSAEGLSVTPGTGRVQLTVLTEGGIDFGTGPLEKGSHYVGFATSSDPGACSSDNPCSVGACDPVKGCVFTDAPDGVACLDQGRAGKCQAGLCCIDGTCD